MIGASKRGMEEVLAAETAITWLDGRTGQLRYRGYPIGELADQCSFEQVAYLLWHGDLPSEAELARLHTELRQRRLERIDLLDLIADIPTSAHPLDVLRYAVSWDALRNPQVADNEAASNREKAVQLTAWFPVVVAGFHRRRAGQKPVRPHPDLDTASNFLYMLPDRLP